MEKTTPVSLNQETNKVFNETIENNLDTRSNSSKTL